MASIDEPPKNLSLKRVSEIVGVPARQIQYLRELGVVVPTVLGDGRGRFCRYSENDIAMVYMCVTELEELSYEMRGRVVDSVRRVYVGEVEVVLGNATKLTIDMELLRSTVLLRINQVVDFGKV
jgi:hypothetical protein